MQCVSQERAVKSGLTLIYTRSLGQLVCQSALWSLSDLICCCLVKISRHDYIYSRFSNNKVQSIYFSDLGWIWAPALVV